MEHSLESWKNFWDQGEAYLRTAQRGSLRPEKFTPEILYNICGMAIEGFFMGYLAFRGNLPENHTLRDLLRAGEKLMDFPQSLKERIARMDRFQEICSLIDYKRQTPSPDDVPEFVLLASEIRDLFLASGLAVH